MFSSCLSKNACGFAPCWVSIGSVADQISSVPTRLSATTAAKSSQSAWRRAESRPARRAPIHRSAAAAGAGRVRGCPLTQLMALPSSSVRPLLSVLALGLRAVAGRRYNLSGLVQVREARQHGARQRRLVAFEAEQAVPDLADRRAGHVCAVAGVRDHHYRDVLGVVTRRERGEHRGRLVALDLGGTGLAGHADLAEREPAEGAGRGTAGDHAGERVPDVGERALGDRQVPGDRRRDLANDLAGRADQRLANPRAVQRAAVGQRGVGAGKLQGGHRDVALADRGDDRLAGGPHVAVPAVLVLDLLNVVAVGPAVLAPVLPAVGVVLPEVVQPFAGRDAARVLLRQVDAGV